MGTPEPDNRRVLVLVEREGDVACIAPATSQLLGMARRMAGELKGPLCAAIIGHEIKGLSDDLSGFADEVYSIDLPAFAAPSAEHCLTALDQLFHHVDPILILMACTLQNVELAPRLAYRMGVQVITDCTQLALEPETGHLLCTKPVYGSKVMSVFRLERRPWIATIRSTGAEFRPVAVTSGKVIPFLPSLEGFSARVETIERVREETVSLTRADAIVAGGRGVRSTEGIEQLKELIAVLKRYFDRVELGASRPLVDARLVPSSRQIGLTGEKVAPQLYLAVAISGSLQHLTGVVGAKRIVAINSDADANIFKVADYGLVTTYEEAVPALKKKLEEL